MNVGTKSVLYGAHCVLIHWLFVALGWHKLYGFRRVEILPARVVHPYDDSWDVPDYIPALYTSLWDVRLWIAFVVHDLGYWGKPNMDGAEGESHPELGYRLMARWFGWTWGDFVLYHSRFYAKKHGAPVSALCFADKMAITFYPAWLYLPMVNWTGEIQEYLSMAEVNSNGEVVNKTGAQIVWFREMQAYVLRWIEEHKNGKEDTWTTVNREAVAASGVWR